MLWLPLTGEILPLATSKGVSPNHFFTPNSCFIYKDQWFHTSLKFATFTGTFARSLTLNKLSITTIQIFYFIKGQNNSSCPRYFLSRLLYWSFGQISFFFSIVVFKVKYTNSTSLFSKLSRRWWACFLGSWH